jgi:hypothetical protein
MTSARTDRARAADSTKKTKLDFASSRTFVGDLRGFNEGPQLWLEDARTNQRQKLLEIGDAVSAGLPSDGTRSSMYRITPAVARRNPTSTMLPNQSLRNSSASNRRNLELLGATHGVAVTRILGRLHNPGVALSYPDPLVPHRPEYLPPVRVRKQSRQPHPPCLPTRSTMDRPSRCWMCLKVGAATSGRCRPQPSETARIARSRRPFCVVGVRRVQQRLGLPWREPVQH